MYYCYFLNHRLGPTQLLRDYQVGPGDPENCYVGWWNTTELFSHFSVVLQADYVMLAAMDDDNEDMELVDGGKKGAIDDLEEGELEKFITQIGIRAYAAQQTVPDEPEEPEDGDPQVRASRH